MALKTTLALGPSFLSPIPQFAMWVFVIRATSHNIGTFHVQVQFKSSGTDMVWFPKASTRGESHDRE
jgi:hypothetical protein